MTVVSCRSAEGRAVERRMIGFREAYARRGIELELGERLALGYQFHIASSGEQAIRGGTPLRRNIKMFGELRLSADLDRRAVRGDARPAPHR